MRLLLPIILLVSIQALGQVINIKRVELDGEKVLVFYDLDDSNPNNEYKLDLFASKDNFTSPLTKVKGDIGAEVKPGIDRKVEWSITDEFGSYKGRIALELRGKVYIPFVKLKDFDTKKAYKKGTSYDLGWKPGNTNPINIELYKGGQRVSGEMNQPNNGSHSLYIPASAKPGNDYRLKITDARNSEDVLFTENFKVKPKLPLLVKVLPVLAVGGVVAALAGGGGGNGGGGGTEVTQLPEAPGAPSGN